LNLLPFLCQGLAYGSQFEGAGRAEYQVQFLAQQCLYKGIEIMGLGVGYVVRGWTMPPFDSKVERNPSYTALV